MSKLTKEQFEQLPDYAKSAFVEDGESYVPVKDATLKRTLDDLDSKYKSTAAELEKFRKEQQDAIEKARLEAFEQAKKEGNTEELAKHWQQKIEDANRRADESKKQFEQRLQALAQKQQSALASELASIATDVGKEAFKALIASRIKVDPETGEETFFDATGSALSVDKKAFMEELKNDPIFKPLVKASVPTNGGGNANGSTGGGAQDDRKFNEYSGAELTELRRRDPAKYDRLKSSFYGN